MKFTVEEMAGFVLILFVGLFIIDIIRAYRDKAKIKRYYKLREIDALERYNETHANDNDTK